MAALWASGCASERGSRAASNRLVARDLPEPARDGAFRRFAWPVAGGVVSSGFGMRNGVMHDGVDIYAPPGTPVRAADRGVVIFSGRLRGYGNVVIIRHDDHYVTVYSHNLMNTVREGQRVARSQIVAEVGSSGRTTGSNLHFEVRRDNLARNPLGYLPALPAPGATSFARGGAS